MRAAWWSFSQWVYKHDTLAVFHESCCRDCVGNPRTTVQQRNRSGERLDYHQGLRPEVLAAGTVRESAQGLTSKDKIEIVPPFWNKVVFRQPKCLNHTLCKRPSHNHPLSPSSGYNLT